MKLLGSKITKKWKLWKCTLFRDYWISISWILSTMSINKIQEFYVHLFQINHLVVPKNHIFLKASKSEFQKTEVWLSDQNSQPLEIKDKINLVLIIK